MPQTPSSSGQTTQVRRVSDQHPLNKVHIASGLDSDDKCSGTDSGTSFSYASPGLMDKARSVSGQSGDSALNQRRTSEANSLTGTRAVDVLIAEDNPISQKILETLLTRMGCRCVCVNDGAEALAASMGTIRKLKGQNRG
jgi:serine/threonine-protein kinase RIM15